MNNQTWLVPWTLTAALMVVVIGCAPERQLTPQERRVADRWNYCVGQQRQIADGLGRSMDMDYVKAICSAYANAEPAAPPTASPAQASMPAPGDPAYEVINMDDSSYGGSCRVDVRIPHEMTRDELGQLASNIKQGYCSNAAIVRIFYWLPGMHVGSGAWATTHYDPNLDVRIFGLTREEKRRLTGALTTENGEKVVGRWQVVPVRVVLMIVRQGDKYFLQIDSASHDRHRLTTSQSGSSRRFVDKNSDFGEYYVIDASGNLRMYDRDGLIGTALKM